MATTEITQKNFEDIASKPGILILDWWAAWCGPCRAFAPIFEKVAAQHQDIVFGKVDTDKEEELAKYFQIRSIPTVIIFRDGVMVFERPGVMPQAMLEDLIKEVRALDMAEVHRKIEESRKNQSAPS